jgi:hypothetical protein
LREAEKKEDDETEKLQQEQDCLEKALDAKDYEENSVASEMIKLE